MTLGAAGTARQLDALQAALEAAAAGGSAAARGSSGGGAPAAAPGGGPHPCAPLALRAPALLEQSPAQLQQRLARLAAALEALSAPQGGGGGGGGSASASGAGARRPVAALAAALARGHPELLLARPQALLGRARELCRALGPETAAALASGRGGGALLAPLLQLRADHVRRRLESLRAMLPGLPPRQLLMLLGRRELRWEQLNFLRHARAVPAWGAHHPDGGGGANASSGGRGSSDGGGGGSSGGGGGGVAALQALHVGRLALCQEPGAFVRRHPEFPGWLALQHAVHPAPGEWGWRAEFDHGLVGSVLAEWLAGMPGRWPRLVALRANAAPLAAAARRRRAAGGGGSGGGGGRPGPGLRELQAMGEEAFRALAAGLPLQLPPPLLELPDADAMELLRLPAAGFDQAVAAHAQAWDALAAAAKAGPPAWGGELARWRDGLPAALGAAAAALGGHARRGCSAGSSGAEAEQEQARRGRVAAWWSGMLDAPARAARLRRLEFLARTSGGKGKGGRGAAPAPSLWAALVADDAAFAAAHPLFATWSAVAALAAGRPPWEAELADRDLSGAPLAAWLRLAASRLRRLQFLSLADGGGAWRLVGLREAVEMEDEAFSDLFPDFTYGAWRLMLGGGGDAGAAGADAGAAGSAAGGGKAVQASAVAGGDGRGRAKAARAGRRLVEAAPRLMEVVDVCPQWQAEARGWDAVRWQRVLRALRGPAGALVRAEFLLATTEGARGGGGAPAVAGGEGRGAAAGTRLPPLTTVLLQSAAAFDAAHPTFQLWAGLRAAAARVAPWRAELAAAAPGELRAALDAALAACAEEADGEEAAAAAQAGAGGAAEGSAAEQGPAEEAGDGGAAAAVEQEQQAARLNPAARRRAAAAVAAAAAAAATDEALARVEFLSTHRRWRALGARGGVLAALALPHAGFLECWPAFDPGASEAAAAAAAGAAAAAAAAALAAAAEPLLAPGALSGMRPPARDAALDSGRLKEVVALAPAWPARWRRALRGYAPGGLEQLLGAPEERFEYLRYVAA
jgi:hypothetical protein